MESYAIQVYKFEQQVKAYNDAIKALEVAKTLADKFDGKVINKRFTNALNEATNAFFGKNNVVIFSLEPTHYDWSHKQNVTQIKLYLSDRCKCYEGGCVYIDYDKVHVYELSSDSECYVNADGRLNKEIYLKALDKQIENCKDAIHNFQLCIDHFDEYLNKVKDFNKKLEELKKEIPYPMAIRNMKIELPFWY